MNESVSEIVVLQRIRNRVIEVLELFADSGENEKSHSLIEFWGDWVESERPANFIAPVFSSEEKECVARVHRAWDIIDMDEPLDSESWCILNSFSKSALTIFMRRGLMSEEVEEQEGK